MPYCFTLTLVFLQIILPKIELYCLKRIVREGKFAYVIRPIWDWCLVIVNLLDTTLAKAFSNWKFERPTSLEASITKARSRVTGQYLMETKLEKRNDM